VGAKTFVFKLVAKRNVYGAWRLENSCGEVNAVEMVRN
jgi:hypothetical protein